MNEQQSPVQRSRHWARAILAHHGSRADDPNPRQIYQTSTIAALLDGVYDGDVTIAELLTHGDFGLGTFNRLDGELVVLDGTCYHLHAEGNVTIAAPDDRTPFAAVTHFVPDLTIQVTTPRDRCALTAAVDRQLPSDNLLYAVRITGRFSTVHTRTVTAQTPPYRSLTDASECQREAVFHDCAGTMVGYRTPDYEQGIAVAGYHLHFLDEDRRRGGHALDFDLIDGTVEASSASELHLSLPRTPEFLGAQLSHADLDTQIRKAEGA